MCYTITMSKLWTPEEVKILKENYKSWGDAERVAKMLGRSQTGITHKASRLGIHIKDGRAKIRKVGKLRYWYICKNREAIFIHRILAEKKIGRKLTSEDIVHHLNGNTLDNRMSNLVVTTRAAHMREYHLDICMEKLNNINNK